MAVLRYGDQEFDLRDQDVTEVKATMASQLTEGKAYWLRVTKDDEVSAVLISAGVPISIYWPSPVDNRMHVSG